MRNGQQCRREAGREGSRAVAMVRGICKGGRCGRCVQREEGSSMDLKLRKKKLL